MQPFFDNLVLLYMHAFRFIILFILPVCAFAQMQVTTGNANLRSSPELGNNILRTIPKGTLLNIVSDSFQNTEWAKVKYNNQVGYVSKNLLRNFINSEESNFQITKKPVKPVGKLTPVYIVKTHNGATAECMDGTYSYSQHRQGTCSHHGGVKKWLK